MSVQAITITSILNGTLQAVGNVIPGPIQPQKPALIKSPITQLEVGVLIGITGDLSGRLILESSRHNFSKIGEAMFGMPVEGEMFDSFVGELGNMIAGNTSMTLAQRGVSIDITPPTVIIGQTKLSGFSQALSVAIFVQNIGEMTLILGIEEMQALMG